MFIPDFLRFLALGLLAGCSGGGSGKGSGQDDTGPRDDTGDTAPLVERQSDCSGMDPADPAPLGGWIALTFDDGPDPIITPQILATLRKYDVPATFFMLGAAADDPENADIIVDILDDPLFSIANHSWDHPNLATLSTLEARSQIGDTLDVLETLGASVEFFRFPFGSATCELVDVVREDFGLNVAGWHIDTGDWCYAVGGGVCSPDDYWRIPAEYQADMYGWTLDQLAAFDGGVFLYHDVHQYTADELEELILTAQAAGYSFTHLHDAEAFPRLNAAEPYDFPWVGESCTPSADTCWQIEYLSECVETSADDVGLCVLDCTESRCIDRDGVAPLFCAEVAPGQGACLPYATGLNEFCNDLPGTVEVRLDGYDSTRNTRVCLPDTWQ